METAVKAVQFASWTEETPEDVAGLDLALTATPAPAAPPTAKSPGRPRKDGTPAQPRLQREVMEPPPDSLSGDYGAATLPRRQYISRVGAHVLGDGYVEPRPAPAVAYHRDSPLDEAPEPELEPAPVQKPSWAGLLAGIMVMALIMGVGLGLYGMWEATKAKEADNLAWAARAAASTHGPTTAAPEAGAPPPSSGGATVQPVAQGALAPVPDQPAPANPAPQNITMRANGQDWTEPVPGLPEAGAPQPTEVPVEVSAPAPTEPPADVAKAHVAPMQPGYTEPGIQGPQLSKGGGEPQPEVEWYTGYTAPPYVPGKAPESTQPQGPEKPDCPAGVQWTGITRPPFAPGCAPAP